MSNKYTGRPADLTEIQASNMRRIGALETNRAGSNVPFGAITDAEYVTPPIAITSGSFVNAYWLFPNSSRRGIEVYMRVITPVGVTMEVQLVDVQVPVTISPVAIIPASTNGFLGLRGRATLSYLNYIVQVQARVASGAGTCRIGLLRAVAGDFNSEQF